MATEIDSEKQIQNEWEKRELPRAEMQATETAQAEQHHVLDPEEAELLGLDQTAPSDPWAAAICDPEPTMEALELDPLQLSRVEQTGLKTHQVTERIERLLDPVEGNGGEDPSRIIIRHLRRLLRRMSAVEESLQRVEVHLLSGQIESQSSPMESNPEPPFA